MTEPIIIQECFHASPEEIWQAITDKEQMKQWYFAMPDFELKENSTFNFYMNDDSKTYHHRCVIKEIVPERLFKHTWTHPIQSKGESVVTWEINRIGRFTLVKLTHQGVESFSDAGYEFKRENYEAGWSEILGKSLRNFLNKARNQKLIH